MSVENRRFQNEPLYIRNAKIRVRAKLFVNQLRTERWAESIPQADIDWMECEATDGVEFEQMLAHYKQTLNNAGCTMRGHDFKWEAK